MKERELMLPFLLKSKKHPFDGGNLPCRQAGVHLVFVHPFMFLKVIHFNLKTLLIFANPGIIVIFVSLLKYTLRMITTEQLKDCEKRRDALRRHL